MNPSLILKSQHISHKTTKGFPDYDFQAPKKMKTSLRVRRDVEVIETTFVDFFSDLVKFDIQQFKNNVALVNVF